jgi:hypothetical protein
MAETDAQQNTDLGVGGVDGSQTADANHKAKSKLHKKNRKGNGIKTILPLNIGLQSGSNYNHVDYAAIMDAKYILTEVEIEIRTGEQGSQTTVKAERCLNYPTSP